MKSSKGFTLIELVMIIVILGILAAVAIPKYIDLQSQAQTAAEKGIVGAVRAAISTYYASKCATTGCDNNASLGYTSLAVCSQANPCFGNVLADAITTDDWEVTAANTYQGPAGTSFLYTDNASNIATFAEQP